MTYNNLDKDFLDKSIARLAESFCPYGWLDLEMAVKTAYEVGETEDWVFDQINEFSQSCDLSFDKIDPCYVVYDSILQEARNEIEELVNIDFVNDLRAGEIYTHGNYLATSYDYYPDGPDQLKEILIEKEVCKNCLGKKTQWFLEQIDVNI